MEQEGLIDYKEARARWGVSPSTLSDWVAKGLVAPRAYLQVGSQMARLFSAKEVEKLVGTRKPGPPRVLSSVPATPRIAKSPLEKALGAYNYAIDRHFEGCVGCVESAGGKCDVYQSKVRPLFLAWYRLLD